mgnify:CR=1 FL=1
MKKDTAEALNALYILAQCAVSVHVLMMTACISVWGFSFGSRTETLRILLRILAIIITILAMIFHIIFKKLALFYVIEILLYTEMNSYHGILNLISLIYNIENLPKIQEEMQRLVKEEKIYTYQKLINSSENLKTTFKRDAYLKIHFGIWTLMSGLLVMQILFIIVFKILGV